MASTLPRPTLAELLEKAKTHYDGDERFMAVNDLISLFKNLNYSLDAKVQETVRNTALAALDDANSDVATSAVKWLSTLVPRLTAENVAFLIDALGKVLVDPKKSARRDIVSDGLRQVLHSLPADQVKDSAPPLVPTLIRGLTFHSKEAEMELATLAVLKELLERFGNDVAASHEDISKTLQQLLDHSSDNVRKAASQTLAPLVSVLEEKIFDALMESLVKQISAAKRPETYIQAISAISKAAGVRVGKYLKLVIPQLMKFLNKDQINKEQSEQTEDLWETVLLAFESLILSCPAQVRDYVPQIVQIALPMTKHDPLFIADEGTSTSSSMMDDSGWGASDGASAGDDWGAEVESKDANGADAWGGDDAGENVSTDSSWRVRRAAVRSVSAVVRSKYERLKEYYQEILKVLVARFQERDSAVREEVLLAARDAIHESVVVGKVEVADDMELQGLAIPTLKRQRSLMETLMEMLEEVLKAVEKLFTSGADIRTRKAIFSTLAEILLVRRGDGVDNHLAALVPQVVKGVESTGKAAEVSASALRVLHLLLEYHKHLPSLEKYLQKLSAAIVAAIKHGIQMNIPDALAAIASLARIINQLPSAKALSSSIAPELFAVTYSQLLLKDVPLNIKLAAIHSMSVILYHHGEQCKGQFAAVLAVLTERLNNDVTRQPTLKAIYKIANSHSKFDLSPIIHMSDEMLTYLRKALHHIKDDTVRAFDALVKSQPSAFKPAQVQSLVREVSHHLSETDLTLAHNILNLSSSIVIHLPSSAEIVDKEMLPKALKLSSSPLLQGAALQALVIFFQNLSTHPAFQREKLISHLLDQVSSTLSKPGAISLSKAIAGIATKGGSAVQNSVVSKFLGADQRSKSDPHAQVALLVVGEIGKNHDLSEFKEIEKVALNSFESKDENVRACGAFALGNVTAGNMNHFLPKLVELCKSSKSSQIYLLFSSLKEVIAVYSVDEQGRNKLKAYVDSITPLLMDRTETEDEAVRSMVAECLGRLSVIEPNKLLPLLAELSRKASPLCRSVAVVGVRFCLSAVLDPSVLALRLAPFFNTLSDEDLEVRRQSLLTVNAIIRFNSELLGKEQMDGVVRVLYSESKKKAELIREIDYGAFKKLVDDGKPLRKAAFQTLDTLLEVAPERLKMSEFLENVKQGLLDDEDIQITTYQTFVTAAQQAPVALVEFLDSLPVFIMPMVKTHLKALADPNIAECIRSLLRALAAFNTIPAVQLCAAYSHFVKQIQATASLKTFLKEMEGSKA